MEVQDFEIGDELQPSLHSFLGNDGDHYQVKDIQGEFLIILRNGWHEFKSLPCYFDKVYIHLKINSNGHIHG